MTFYIAIESAPFLENKESNVASFAVVIFNFVMVLVFFSSSVCVCRCFGVLLLDKGALLEAFGGNIGA